MWGCGQTHRCNLVWRPFQVPRILAAVATDEPPTLQTLWQYALRFQIEELFLDSKSGAFELTDSRLRSTDSLERLYMAVALLYATTQGMAVQLAGCHKLTPLETWLELSQIGLRWLNGVLHKGEPC